MNQKLIKKSSEELFQRIVRAQNAVIHAKQRLSDLDGDSLADQKAQTIKSLDNALFELKQSKEWADALRSD